MKDKMCGILACAHEIGDKCWNIKITGNIVASVATAGVDASGYAAPGNDCGDTTTVIFKDNIAHSISENGANIFRNHSSPT
jgi:hypothetical protein